MDTITFLRSPETVGSKRFTPAGVIAYAAPFGPYEAIRAPVANLEAAAEVLRQCPPDAYHVRGRPVGDASTIPYRRHRTKDGSPPTLEGEPHRLLPIDIDADADGMDGTDVHACAAAWRDMLPEPFRRALCYAVATSSAGIKPGSRVRLWFWLSRPITDHEAKTWLRDSVRADLAIYTPSQPIYCAPPTFDSVADPFEGRARDVWLDGAPAVRVPDQFDRPEREPLRGFGAAAAPTLVGTRNNHLTSIAGTMRRRGLEADAIAAALHAHNDRLPEPLPRDEVDAIAHSVSGYDPEAIAAPPKSSKAAKRARRTAEKRLEDDPGLLSTVAIDLARHVRSGAISEGEAVSTLQRGLDASAVATTHTREDLSRLLDAAPVIEATAPHWAADAILSDDGNPVPCPENLRLLLVNHPDFSLWFNSRSQQEQWERCPWREPGPVKPTDDFALRAYVSKHLGWHRCPAEPLAAIAEAARVRAWDPWRAFLETLEWDGTPRIEDVPAQLLGCEDTEANRYMFGWWMISAVARSFEPGCQVDHVLVLEGRQMIGKTSFLRALAMHDQFFTRLVSGADLNSPRTIAKIHGPVIIEMAELAVLRRAEVESIKAFLDERTDRVQWLYSRKPVDVHRSCVFAATTNDDEYLRDSTGNRRFWPLHCTRIDLAKLDAIRAQLWAEAVHMYKHGVKWYPTPEDVIRLGLTEIQAQRQEPHPGQEDIETTLAMRWRPGRHALTGVDIAADQLDEKGYLVRLGVDQLCRLIGRPVKDSRLVARTLKALGWEASRGRVDGTRVRLWTAPGAHLRGDYPKELN